MTNSIVRYPARMEKNDFYPRAYYWMYLSRKMEEKFAELFRKRYVKGTVTLGIGNEATSVGIGLPMRRGVDVLSFLHRDAASHLIMGTTPYQMFCQYIANADSPTHGREGNAHHGNNQMRRFPMISHLGDMLSLVVGGTWFARRNGEDVVGCAVAGDGGTSTGDFHESLNIASVRNVPVLFLVENNHYAYSTPTRLQYHCEKLSDRAAGYGIVGKTIDGTDVWEVYNAVCDAMDHMRKTSQPYLLECMALRLEGHAVYDKALYVTAEERAAWMKREPLARARAVLAGEIGYTEQQILDIESKVASEIDDAVRKALAVGRPDPIQVLGSVYAPAPPQAQLPSFSIADVKNVKAVTCAQEYLLENNPNAFIMGMDVGPYGSAFATCKGLHARFGSDRVLDMPIAESSITGFALGASQVGGLPIVEYQFADFSTEAATQIGLNCATWYFRTGSPARILFRLPCGGGITLGAFHSGEFDGIWSRFPGLKVLYPYTTQETFEALVAGFYDPNPCIVLEHKLFYGSKGGSIAFDGTLDNLMRPRKYTEGSAITIVGFGAGLATASAAIEERGYSAELWNPFVITPAVMEPIYESVRKTGRFLVVQESTDVAGMGNHYASLVARNCFSSLTCAPEVISAPGIPVPFAPELEAYYRPNKEQIISCIDTMTGVKK